MVSKLASLHFELIGLAVAEVAEDETDQPNRSDVGMDGRDETADSRTQEEVCFGSMAEHQGSRDTEQVTGVGGQEPLRDRSRQSEFAVHPEQSGGSTSVGRGKSLALYLNLDDQQSYHARLRRALDSGASGGVPSLPRDRK